MRCRREGGSGAPGCNGWTGGHGEDLGQSTSLLAACGRGAAAADVDISYASDRLRDELRKLAGYWNGNPMGGVRKQPQLPVGKVVGEALGVDRRLIMSWALLATIVGWVNPAMRRTIGSQMRTPGRRSHRGSTPTSTRWMAMG